MELLASVCALKAWIAMGRFPEIWKPSHFLHFFTGLRNCWSKTLFCDLTAVTLARASEFNPNGNVISMAVEENGKMQ
jgi:hypothetical protein